MRTQITRMLWSSGFVNRWHANRDPRLRNSFDTTAAHAQRVAVLVMRLWPKSKRSVGIGTLEDHLLSALMHDAPESLTGDVPYPAKMGFPDLEKALREVESAWFDVAGINPAAYPLVKLCDHVDAIMFCGMHAPDLLNSEQWQESIRSTINFADSLGVRAEIEGLIQ